jgi:DNA-binding transcriptional ArsR family regulator
MKHAPVNAMRVELLADKADHAAAVLKAISNKYRLLVLCQLVKGEKPVGELEHVIGLSQSALSQHLAVLRKHKLVKTRREAQMIFYSLRGSEAPAILGALYELYCRPSRANGEDLSTGRRRPSPRSKRALARDAS